MKLATIYCAIAALTIPTTTLAKKFNREQSRQQIEQAVAQRKAAITDELRREWDAKAFTTTTPEGDFTMPIWDTVYGAKPEGGRSLYISLHGGGGGPAQMNDGQWSNQKKLYRPAEGVYVAPRVYGRADSQDHRLCRDLRGGQPRPSLPDGLFGRW